MKYKGLQKRPLLASVLLFKLAEIKKYMNPSINMKLAFAGRTQQTAPELQPLHDYLELYKEGCERYEYLKRSGVSDSVLFVEKGLLSRQLQFLLNSCEKLGG